MKGLKLWLIYLKYIYIYLSYPPDVEHTDGLDLAHPIVNLNDSIDFTAIHQAEGEE